MVRCVAGAGRAARLALAVCAGSGARKSWLKTRIKGNYLLSYRVHGLPEEVKETGKERSGGPGGNTFYAA